MVDIDISIEAKDLINNLLEKNNNKRIGQNGGQGIEDYMEILKHPWFHNIDVQKVFKKQIVPALMPKSYIM